MIAQLSLLLPWLVKSLFGLPNVSIVGERSVGKIDVGPTDIVPKISSKNA